MTAPSPFHVDTSEPLAFWLLPAAEPCPLPGVRELRFEYTSRGDRVPGRLLLPSHRPGASPLLLVVHGAGESKAAASLDAACGPWVGAGAAVAAIDLPLHGERASAKLSERLLQLLARQPRSPLEAELWIGFVRQAVVDLRRALAALEHCEHVDSGRTAFAGFCLGAILGAPFCAEEPRIRAAALAIGGGGFGPVAVDPIGHVGRLAPRPLLLVNATRDERVSRAQAEALHEAAGEPKEVLWFECGHAELPERALDTMGRFLARHLAV